MQTCVIFVQFVCAKTLSNILSMASYYHHELQVIAPIQECRPKYTPELLELNSGNYSPFLYKNQHFVHCNFDHINHMLIYKESYISKNVFIVHVAK